jgi:hypothetical protein
MLSYFGTLGLDQLYVLERLMSKRLTRKEFYDLVWSKPITHIAKDFGLSDVAIHKICKKHDIPNPPLGWWAKKAHGKAVVQTPLPTSDNDVSDIITIVEGNRLHESDDLKAAREQARIVASNLADQPELPRNPIVDKTIAALRKAKPNDRGLICTKQAGLIAVSVGPASLDRLEIVLDVIVQAAHVQDFVLTKSDTGVLFSGHDAQIKFEFLETVKRIAHVLTPEELAEQERNSKRRGRNNWDMDFSFRLGLPEWDYIPTGQVGLELEHFYVWPGTTPRRAFKDGKSQRLEKMADEIAVGLVVYAAAKRDQRGREEERARQAEQDRRQREMAQRKIHIEQRRLNELDAILSDLEKTSRFRVLVDSLKLQLNDRTEGRAGEFLQWAICRLESAEGKLTAAGMERRFEENRVFGCDDDFSFKADRWT